MPKVKVGDIEMYFEIHGAGEPVLLILSPGSPLEGWVGLMPALARECQVVAFDGRGAGRTDAPQTPYSMAGFADDAAGLMDALCLPAASVVGASMGGAVALELVLRHPQRVQALVLAGVSPGGREHVLSPQFREVQRVLAGSIKQPDSIEAQRALAEFALAPGTIERRPDVVQEFISYHTSPMRVSLHNQILITQAIRSWLGSYDRLSQIRVPTLVMTGEQDMMTSPQNSQILHERIDGSALVILPNVGHGFMYEAPEAASKAIVSFLRRVARNL